MNVENRPNACETHQDELWRLAYDDLPVIETSPALRAHLATCEPCRELVRESREWLGALAQTLQPEPLPAALERRICDHLSDAQASNGQTHEAATRNALFESESRNDRRRALLSSPLRLIGAALAACLLAGAFVSQPTSAFPHGTGHAETLALSPDDATELLFTWSLLRWTGPLEESVEQLTDFVQTLEGKIQPASETSRPWPWTPNDDWDAPPAEKENSSQTAPRLRPVVS